MEGDNVKQLEELLTQIITLFLDHEASLPKQLRKDLIQEFTRCVLSASRSALGRLPKEFRGDLLPLLLDAEFELRGLKEDK